MKRTACLMLLLISSIFATTGAIQKFANELITGLDISPGAKLSVTVLEEDRKHMLTLSPVFDELRDQLSGKVEVDFHSGNGSSVAVLYQMISSGRALSTEAVADTLILSGSYEVESSDLVYCTIELMTTSQRKVCEETFEIHAKSAPAAYRAKLFFKIKGEEKLTDVKYTGKVIEKLDALMNSEGNRVFLANKAYRIRKLNPYAVLEQVAIFRSVLTSRYGITDSPNSSSTISILNGGAVEIQANGEKSMLAGMIDGESMMPDMFDDEMSSMGVATLTPSNTIAYEDVPYQDDKMKAVRSSIVKTFEVDYPKMFAPFNMTKLKSVFKGGVEPRIFVGRVAQSDPKTGREVVEYNYITRDKWLAGLQSASSKGRIFDIDTKVMNIYTDPIVSSRFFAVVKQSWDTKFNKRVVYHDDGFLIISFDYDFRNGRARDFKIHQRLWFYDYRYDDRELGMSRVAKLRVDLDKHFVNRKMQGISSDLKMEIRNLILKKADQVDQKLRVNF